MQFPARIKSLWPFRWPLNSAAQLAVSVALALLIVQIALSIPVLWSNETRLLKQASETEYVRVERLLSQDSAAKFSNIATSDSLLGLTVYSRNGSGVLAMAGKSPSESVEIAPSNSAGPAHSYLKRDGFTLNTNWHVDYREQILPTRVTLNVAPLVKSNRALAVKLFIFSIFSSILAGFASLWLARRFFAIPIDETLEAIRKSRDSAGAGLTSAIDHETTPELQQVTSEFNSLREEQRTAARQVKVKQQYLEYAAHHDPMTHLSNRLMFEECLNTSVADALDENGHFALFLLDLDNFKFFNDQYGNLIGDKMVMEIGSRLQSLVRNSDLVARLDGDEFVVIHNEVPERQNIEAIADRIMSEISEPFEYRGFTLKASVSMGISYFPADVQLEDDRAQLAEEILNNAFVALQEAKLNGKNQYQMFNEAMRLRLTERHQLEVDLKAAVSDNQFEVYYQPKIDAITRRVTGSEALVRWNHPTRGRISPELFVPVAEEAGLIIEIGEWILRTACRQTHILQQIGFKGLQVAVNISAVQFTDGNLLPMVSQALRDSSLQPELLELEITESAVMHDPQEVIDSLHELSRFGMRLAIDDFGTGYSSLAYLKKFPVDTLKIDRAFIIDISSDNDDVAIVEAVLGLGKHFNMKIVAEGVEDEAQLNFLSEQGCDLAQGFYISQPMNFQDYIDWLEKWPHGIQTAETSTDSEDAADIDLALLQQVKRAS